MAQKEFFDLVVRGDDQSKGMFSGIGGNILKLAAGVATVGAMTSALKASFDAAVETEAVYNDLAASVERAGGVWLDVEDNIRAFTGTLQAQTGLSDEAIARSIQSFLDMGNSGKKSMELVKSAADLAAGGHINLASATDLVAKASVGYTATLSRYGIILDESLSPQEKFAAALEKIDEMFGGAAVARMKTQAAQLALLGELYGDLKENIGLLIAGPAADLLSFLNNMLTVVNSNIGGLMKLGTVLSFVFGGDRVNEQGNFMAALAGIDIIAAQLKAEAEALANAMEEFGGSAGDASGDVALVGKELKEFIAHVQEATVHAAEFAPSIALGYETARVSSVKASEGVATFNDSIAEQDRLLGSIPGSASEAAEAISQMTDAESAEYETMLADYDAMRAQMVGITVNAVNRMVSEFAAGRATIGDIFKGMASDFLQAFTSKLITKGVNTLFSSIFPSPTGIATAIVGDSLGIGGGGVLPKTASAAQSVTIVNIDTMIGDERYVRDVVVPVIEREGDLNNTRISVTGGA